LIKSGELSRDSLFFSSTYGKLIKKEVFRMKTLFQSIILKSVDLLFESMGLLFDALTTKSLDFNSRASRKEYNVCLVFWSIVYLVAMRYNWQEKLILIWIPIVYLLFSIALLSRRLHDLNWRGWWQLSLWLFPISGIILCFLKGTSEANRFGEVPK
jgi:uncharacterized membrane protein YhaH (DUF805 family)